MAMGRPKAALVLGEEEQAQLLSLARSRSLPAALVRRAGIVLACATWSSASSPTSAPRRSAAARHLPTVF
jgi:hypothetical protein